MIKKIKQKKGETLIETLVSMLIALLAMGLITTAVTVAGRMNQRNRDADQEFSKELEQVEIYMAKKTQTDMTILFEDGSHKNVTVDVYGEGSRFASFKQEVD